MSRGRVAGVRIRRCVSPLQMLVCVLIGNAIGLLAVVSAHDLPPDPFEKTPQLHAASAAEAKEMVFAWLDEQRSGSANIDSKEIDRWREQIAAIWSSAGEPTGTAVLETVVASFAVADKRAADLVTECEKARSTPLGAEQSWLADPMVSAFERENLRLYYGRWLAQQNLFEESAEQLAGIEPESVVDPATLLFHQAVNDQQLLKREEGLKALRRLLDDVADIPTRYRAVAALMEADLQGLEDDSLDHIARRMQDIERRLDLGRPGARTREVEDGVIASLDKLIKELEQQEQQQQSSGGSGGATPQAPASDSRIMGGSGRGETRKKKLGDSGGWGSLPPKERNDALQQIGKDFPSHYRDVVEQYFRRLATERSEKRGD